jgi:glycosyltransferase involved in cell wall biosynthesis
MKLSVLMPCYNESATIREIVARVLAVQGLDLELIVVDDGSTDGTRAMLERMEDPRLRIVFHTRNAGKGAAIRTAIKHAEGDICVIQDADLEYDPNDLPSVVKPIIDGKADAVYGSRFTGPHRSFMYWHYVGNKFLTFLTNVLYGQILTDMETCYKAFRSEYARRLDLRANRFDIEPEITAKLARMGARLYEVPISYAGRTFEEGKKITWRDGFAAIWTLVKWRFKPLKVGEQTLENIGSMRRFNKWIYDKASPALGARILEAGCGIGNFTRLLLGRERLACVDFDEEYVKRQIAEYGDEEEFEGYHGDLSSPEIVKTLGAGSVDSIVCINVLEHIPDHESTLDNFRELLAPGGKLFLLVPAHPWLFCPLDEGLDHQRRYRKAELRELVAKHGLVVERVGYFNFFGIFGWLLNGKILRQRILSSAGLGLYERLVPLFRLFEKVTGPPIGLSLLVWARRPGGRREPARRRAGGVRRGRRRLPGVSRRRRRRIMVAVGAFRGQNEDRP